MNPWDGIATPDDGSAITNMATGSPWDGIALPETTPKQAPPESTLDKVLGYLPHQAGMISKDAFIGATALPTLMANIPAATANGIVNTYNYIGNGNANKVPYVNPYGEGANTVFGDNAQPRNGAERFENAVLTPAFGVAAGGAAGQSIAAGETPLTGGNLLSSNMPAQYGGAIGGGTAGHIASEMGSPGWVQTAASFGGGLAGGGATSAGANALQRFTNAGQNQIVANTVKQIASDPEAAQKALSFVPEYVPGSMATGGTASGDLGLMGLEKSMSSMLPYQERMAANESARNKLLNIISGTPADIEQSQATRSSMTQPFYDRAATAQIDPKALGLTMTAIDSRIASVGAGSDAGKILTDLKTKIAGSLPNTEAVPTGLVDASGSPINRPNFTNTTAGPATQIYKETRDKLNLKADNPGFLGSTVKGEIIPINKQFGAALAEQNPDQAWGDKLWGEQSGPINNMENMQNIQSDITNGRTGNISPMAIGNLLQRGEVNTARNGWTPLEEALDTNQNKFLGNIGEDVSRADLIGAKSTPAGDINKAIGGQMIQKLPIPGLNQMYVGADSQIRHKLLETVMSPQNLSEALQNGQIPPGMLERLMGVTGASVYGSQMGGGVGQ